MFSLTNELKINLIYLLSAKMFSIYIPHISYTYYGRKTLKKWGNNSWLILLLFIFIIKCFSAFSESKPVRENFHTSYSTPIVDTQGSEQPIDIIHQFLNSTVKTNFSITSFGPSKRVTFVFIATLLSKVDFPINPIAGFVNQLSCIYPTHFFF